MRSHRPPADRIAAASVPDVGESPRLPSFVIVGTHKGGTSSLLQFMCRHPQVGRPARKELHFFDRHFQRGLDWYVAQFPAGRKITDVGEATPLYMYDPVARRRLARTLPHARIIVTLRDPVKRAYSHYWHARRYGKENLSFEAALAAEPERIVGASRRSRASFSYVDRGRYLGQLLDLEQRLGRDALCITSLEQTIADPATEITRVLEHLGLDPSRLKSTTMPRANAYASLTPAQKRRLAKSGRKLPADMSRSYPPMDPETAARLRAQFAEDNEQLREWLGWGSLPWPVGP